MTINSWVQDINSVNMASVADDATSEENILYELLVCSEWSQEIESLLKAGQDRSKTQNSSESKFQTSLLRRIIRNIGLPFGKGSQCLPQDFINLMSAHMAWQFAVGNNGKIVAILQDHIIEIRSAKDEFSTLTAKCSVAKDLYPQWRRLAWSPDGTFLACSRSNGTVDVFDISGSLLFSIDASIYPEDNIGGDLQQAKAISALLFTNYKPNETWSSEMLVINYAGVLKNYYISSTNGYQENHLFHFEAYYPNGVTAAVFHPTHNLLIIGGSCDDSIKEDSAILLATQQGITAWRLLADFPHYKLITDYESDKQLNNYTRGLIKRIQNFRLYGSKNQDGIYGISLSPDGSLLASLHLSGKLTVWDIPSLRQRNVWTLDHQPTKDEINPALTKFSRKRKRTQLVPDSLMPHLLDISWWSNEALILARCSGAVTISSRNTLKNLLGQSCEWFESCPQLSPAYDGGFLGLECESNIASKKLRRDSLTEEENNVEYSSDDDEATIITRTKKVVRQALFYVTDSERFQPPRKKPRIKTNTYRLVCLKSTTPEELYARKIDNEEYGEALALAKAYNLDCDLVYQRQWRKSRVSEASIRDYLSKISKRSWVLHECLERVPEDVDAAQKLLKYGLQGTELEALVAIGKGEDYGRFLHCTDEDMFLSMEYEDFTQDDLKNLEEEKKKVQLKLMKQLDFSNLTLEQKLLCQQRMKLLQYLDRLLTYEMILGGAHAAEELYDPKAFQKFRSQNLVEAAIEFSRNSDWRAVEAIFIYHGAETFHYRLPILSNFPETTSPLEYRTLLPEASQENNHIEVVMMFQAPRREKDWCEEEPCKSAVSPCSNNLGTFLYEDSPHLKQFEGEFLTKQILTEWYTYRAQEIERLSRSVDNALELVKLGMEKNVQGLKNLYDDLLTMETLVYECHLDTVTFASFQSLNNLEKLSLLISKTSDELYVKNFKRWIVPFLERHDKHNPGASRSLLRDYLISLATDDLSLCRKIFENSKIENPHPLISNMKDSMSIALECIYICKRNDQLNHALAILECLPKRGVGMQTKEVIVLHNHLDEMELHLRAAELLQKHDVFKPLFYIRDSQFDLEESKELLVKLTRTASRRSPPLSSAEWKLLLNDILLLRRVYKCVSEELCFEVFTESLLCSGNKDNICFAGEMIEKAGNENKMQKPIYLGALTARKVGYCQAVELVLKAAREYFNSSANLSDPCMKLAKKCLQLIEDCPDIIQVELDLIESLSLLEEFKVNMLPLQVHLCKERLEIIKHALESSPSAYKNSKLLKLAYQLRVSGDDRLGREGRVQTLMAEKAFQVKDYDYCFKVCIRLIEANYGKAWNICKSLGECEDFKDLHDRCKLIAFAVTHCDSSVLDEILYLSCHLKTRILCHSFRSEIGGDKDEKNETNDVNAQITGSDFLTPKKAFEHTKSKTLQVLTSTTMTTKAIFASVSNKQWWKNTISWVQPSDSSDSLESSNRNWDFSRQGCQPFYSEVVPKGYYSTIEVDYGKKNLPEMDNFAVQFSQSLLRTALLEETLTKGESSHLSSEVLLQLAEAVLPEDTSLGLAYLLSLPKAVDAGQCFDKLPRTSITLHLATYYYALQISSKLIHIHNKSENISEAWLNLYNQPVNNVINNVIDFINRVHKFKLNNDVAMLVEKFQHYEKLLSDFVQAQTLQNLGRGVDVLRFAQDDQYKKDTITGLAMTVEDDVYEIAVSLASKYEMPLWDVYMTHLEFLFSDSGLSTQEMENRVKNLGLIPLLSSEPEQMHQRLLNYVYPTIEGKDHGRLLYFYTLMQNCKEDIKEEDIKPETHIAVLKKFRPATPGLDYKALFDGKSNPLMVIQKVLTKANVHVISKQAHKIPALNGGYLEPSLVFCAWVQKYFWEEDQSSQKMPDTASDWIQHYKACGEYAKRLSPNHFEEFINGITFVEKAVEMLSVDCRKEILSLALEHIEQQIKKSKAKSNSMAWGNVSQHLLQSLDHLKKLETIDMFSSKDKNSHQYYVLLDLSRSEPDKLKELLTKMVLNGESLHMVNDTLQAFELSQWTVLNVITEAINLLIHCLRDPIEITNYLPSHSKPLDILKSIVQHVKDHQESGGTLASSEAVLSLLRPFCGDGSLPVRPRLDVLQLLEQSFDLKEDDLLLLMYHRTQAIIADGWPDQQIKIHDVEMDENRLFLFQTLASSSSSLQHFSALSQLLQCWPTLTTQPSGDSFNPWTQLFTMLASCAEEGADNMTVNLVKKLHSEKQIFIAQCGWYIFDMLLKKGSFLQALKVALTLDDLELHKAAIEKIVHQNEESSSVYDDELLYLFLHQHLTPLLVNTSFYHPLIEYLLANQKSQQNDSYSVHSVASELHEAGFESEAGSLLLAVKSTHRLLQTFDAALDLVSRWFTRKNISGNSNVQ